MSKILEALDKAAREKGAQPQPSHIKEEMESRAWADILPPEKPSLDSQLVTILEPQSFISEQFRKLRSKLLHSPNGGPRPRAILVTSALPKEGKSFVAVNLAASIARGIHERVLLVDCDLRRPHLPEYFGLKPGAGLVNYLKGEVELPQILIKTEIEKLSLLPMGHPPANPVELLASERMKNLLVEMRSRYEDRYLIIDSTPVISTTEPRVLASQVDGIVLVVRAGKTPREMVLKAIEALAPAKVTGIVLNALRSSLAKYYDQHF